MSRFSIIGGGFSGLSAACFAAQAGHDVTIFEKNTTIGGRARSYSAQGFVYDMGPSWYWMPDVFEKFFNSFDKKASDYYDLKKLDPGFQVFFKEGQTMQVPASADELYAIFEQIEHGAANKLKAYLSEAEVKYRLGMQELVYKPALSIREFMSYKVIKGVLQTNVFKSLRTHVRSYFKDPRLVALMEFPVLFLGAMPQDIPSLYSLMNYAALVQGTYYPMGGMYTVIEAMEELALSLGVEIRTNAAIKGMRMKNGLITTIETEQSHHHTDVVISSCDYHHTEAALLGADYSNYNEKYWDKKTFAPSCLIFYLGVNKRINKLIHHNLFFDADLDIHAKDIYENPKWPEEPLFYACCPSKTDNTVAPEGMENIFLLMPIAPGIEDNETLREHYFNVMIARMEKICGEPILPNIIYKKSYCVTDFVDDYYAYKGNAYGLANTLRQTAMLKPSIRNKKLKNLFYTGQLTVPGPGVPPSIISGEIAAGLGVSFAKKHFHEAII